MRLMRLAMFVVTLIGLNACGGDADITCDKVRTYQEAQAGKRVVAPDDLDGLEPLREMPLPQASPQAPRPPGSPCIDRPPQVNIGE